MSQYNKKIQFITKMNSDKPFNIKNLSDLIKNLHNHEQFDFPQQFGQISPLQLATLSVLNLQINESLDILKHKSEKPRAYFERQIFVISNKLRKVGQIVKIISSLCQFNDSRQEHLARFDTVNFYQQSSDFPLRYLNYLKGIFPSINVHKDNIPLYMPFYEKLDRYHSNIGNPNWEIARANLDFIYRKEIMDHSDTTEEEHWYLLLTGNRKILQIYNKTSIEEVWAFMYIFYMNSTLKPYRNMNSNNESSKQINLDQVVELIWKNLKNETNKEVSQLLSFILYVLTDNTNQLEKSFTNFQQQFKTYIKSAQTDPQSKGICSKWGLTNAMYCQLLHNLLDHIVGQGFQDPTEYRKLQFLFDDSIRLTENLTEKAIPYYDFYLRICYSSNSNKEDKLKRIHENILSVLRRSLQKNTNGFPFPQYGWWQKDVLEPFSTSYLQKYPQKIIEIVKYLPKETAIWKLLTCEKLSDSGEFKKIGKCLQENRNAYVEQIQRKVNISETDYDGFLRLWEDFHQIVAAFDNQGDFRVHLSKVERGFETFLEMISMNMNSEFRRNVYLPFNKSENILRAMNSLIKGYEQLLPDLNENEKRTLVKAYLSIVLDSRIKAELIGALSQEDATEFWKKWSLVYMNDQSLVDQLVKSNQPIEDYEMGHQMGFRIEEEGRMPPQHNHHEVMDLQ